MSSSEIIILSLIYSGLLIFFLVPSPKMEQVKVYKGQLSLPSIFKNTLVKLVFQKKAIFALALLGFALYGIQSWFVGEEWHYNAHSGYPPISYKLPALLTMGSAVIYTVILFLVIGYVSTIKSIKNAKYQA